MEMKQNELTNQELLDEEFNIEDFDFDLMEELLDQDIEGLSADLKFLVEEKEKIGSPENLGKVINDVIWEQFQNQIAVTAGKDFIKDNHGKTLDLRNSAHIQTAENFKKGKLATHNYKSIEKLEKNYERYSNKPHSEFRKEYVNPGMDATLKRAGELNKQGTKTVPDIYTGKKISTETKLANGKNNPKAAQREHVNPSAEVYKNASLQMAYDDKELSGIINNPHNLQGYTTAERNNRKSDKSTTEMDKKDQTKHYEKAKEESDKFIKQKEKEGEERLKREGRQTQKEEAFRIGKTAVRAVVLQLLSDLVRKIISKLVKWFKSGNKALKTLLDNIKEAIHDFVGELKQNLINAGNTMISTIMTAIVGPIFGTLKKVCMMLKQGWSALKDAINYMKDPENKTKSLGILLMEAGKIVIAGLTGIGAMVLGETIEKGLMTIPIFAVEIPFLGSLASILGIFFGAVVSGIIGAFAINRIEKLIEKRQKQENSIKTVNKNNEILRKQKVQIALAEKKLDYTKEKIFDEIDARHREANDVTREILDEIFTPVAKAEYDLDEMQADLESLL
ncbi:cation diffusion facilitator family transporter [Streptococcus constellatus]|uniref:cation diffusion facilitator family transporter n=1 Tax=Streptococcus constellatus TaxID=76860 RepID=UPI000E5BFC06|nr:cation diffusion facilitator family transporter [Streptococcus constellatus]RID96359.1 cation diffusion facilitator family transporter [Streptococcus constellatus]